MGSFQVGDQKLYFATFRIGAPSAVTSTIRSSTIAKLTSRATCLESSNYGRLSQTSVSPALEEDLIDNLLKAVRRAREDTRKSDLNTNYVPQFMPNRAALLLKFKQELILLDGSLVAFTQHGGERCLRNQPSAPPERIAPLGYLRDRQETPRRKRRQNRVHALPGSH